VISPEQLASALDRLDPRDRELLALSLRRRVPDDDLARMYDVDAPEVARRRAAAIDRLSGELGIQRGEDLGAVLKALLEDDIWSATGAPGPAGEEFAAGREPAPDPEKEPEPEPEPAVVPVPTEPVLEMLAAREGKEPPPAKEPPAEPEAPKERRIPHLAFALFGIGLAALLGAVALVALTELGDDGQASVSRDSAGDDGTRHFVPEETGPAAAPFPSEPQEFSCYTTAYVRRPALLRRQPAGKALMRLASKTEWQSPRVFGVVRREGDWLAVQAPELPNGRVGWLNSRDARLDCTTWSLHADLSKKKLFVRREGHTVRALPVAIGRSTNPTPKGRFSVTDKLRVTDSASPYGCCVLALSGHQTNLPADWPGGDRLAVHATQDAASIGQAASLGCLRSHPDQVRWLIETIPLGAPVFIRS
jgi:L,D-transpeptidase catalytic domain